MSDNGKETVEKMNPFILERSLPGVANGYMEIAERIMNGSTTAKDGQAASHALDGVSKAVKATVDIIKAYETGSSKARDVAAKILQIEHDKAEQEINKLEHKE